MLNIFKRRSKRELAPQPPTRETWVSREILECTTQVLRESGRGELHEGVAYWAGRRTSNGESVVTTVLAPAAQTSWGSFDTTSHANARVIMRLAEASVELIGQVHSHPGRFIDHSDGDDDRAFMPYEGFISLVVPDHARSGMIPLSTCGVHIFEHGRFRRLSDAEVISSFHVVDAFVDLR